MRLANRNTDLILTLVKSVSLLEAKELWLTLIITLVIGMHTYIHYIHTIKLITKLLHDFINVIYLMS